MLYVGIDIAKHLHCAAAINDTGTVVLKPTDLPQSTEDFDAFDATLRTLGEPAATRIGMEATGHYWLVLAQYLIEKGWQVRLLNPLVSAAESKKNIRGRITDQDAAVTIAKLIREGHGDPPKLPSIDSEQLKTLCRQRRYLSSQSINAKKRLGSLRDRVFPEFKDCFSETCGASARAVLAKYPSAHALAAAHLTALTTLLDVASNGKLDKEDATRIRGIAKHSCAARINDPAGERAIQSMLTLIEHLEEQMDDLDEHIGTLVNKDNTPICTIKGLGPATAATIQAEVGNIARFNQDNLFNCVLAYAGLDPRIRKSGKWIGKVKMSKRGSVTLRSALFKAAFSVSRTEAFKSVYESQIARGKHHYVALSHVARKLVHVICAIMVSGQQFDPRKVCTAQA